MKLAEQRTTAQLQDTIAQLEREGANRDGLLTHAQVILMGLIDSVGLIDSFTIE
jgi:hypothetical protein